MYLVELRPGKEELYRSSDELALAIRNGDVDARSRVYHRATAKWISITLHPQYKAIVTAAKEEPSPRPTRRWGILGGSSAQTGEPAQGASGGSDGNLLQRWRRPLALGLSGLLLISGIQLAFWGPRPPWAGHRTVARVTTERTGSIAPVRAQETERASVAGQSVLGEGQGIELVSLASTTARWAEPRAADTLARPATPRPVLPRAPKLQSRSLREALTPESRGKVKATSLDALLARYVEAHESARARLETGIRVARLTRIFAASRLSPNGGITDTRMSLAGAANFIRVFRQQQATIEAAYQDSVTMLARRYGWPPSKVRQWYSRPAQKEPPTLELLSGSLLASIDSMLGVLAGQAGAYKIRGNAIAFEDPTAGQRYGSFRRQIKEQIEAAIAAGGAMSTGPAGLLLQAIGTSTLPRET